MPTNIKIIHTQDFIRAKPDGVLDLTASAPVRPQAAPILRTSWNYKDKNMEAEGIEPSSESDPTSTTTCLARGQFSSRKSPQTSSYGRDLE